MASDRPRPDWPHPDWPHPDWPHPDWPRLDWQRHAIFLDFDGTLAPIVPRPEQAAIAEPTRGAVRLMLEKTGGALAILSGRDLEDLDGLRAIHGNMVSEVAVAGANKGVALDAFMAEPPFAGRIPFVAGDDTTDEDAFEAAQRRGGVALKIGGGPSVAALRVEAIEAFLDWLHAAAEQ